MQDVAIEGRAGETRHRVALLCKKSGAGGVVPPVACDVGDRETIRQADVGSGQLVKTTKLDTSFCCIAL